VRQDPGRYVLLYQDEGTFYRQPTQASLWAGAGRKQPPMSYSCRSNTRMRLVGYLNATSGAVHSEDMKAVTVKQLAKSVSQLSTWYPQAETIYLVWDNWPNHAHQTVMAALQKQERVKLIWLPTYAPWLNAIEKLWRWLRQRVTHTHPWCDDFHLFRQQVRTELDSLANGSQSLLRYVGMST
jgi:hypothetical protein